MILFYSNLKSAATALDTLFQFHYDLILFECKITLTNSENTFQFHYDLILLIYDNTYLSSLYPDFNFIMILFYCIFGMEKSIL